MNAPRIDAIAGQDAATHEALRALNNANARETSFLEPARWDTLVDRSFAATCIAPAAALLIAFDHAADYDSVNFHWFRDTYPRFVYIDRVVVDADHRGSGLARVLYDDLFDRTAAAGHHLVVCEVNSDPPNPGSDAFHARLGFTEVGQARLDDAGKTVRYLARRLDGVAVG